MDFLRWRKVENKRDLIFYIEKTAGRESGDCVMQLLKSFLWEEFGATSIEYALIAAFIAIGIVSGATQIGLDLSNIFNSVDNAF